MERRFTASINSVALLLLAGLFALNLYRAATQSITTDEAVTFDRWVRPPLRDMLRPPYDPNNHVLYSVLVKRTVGLLRLSEFSLRLPAVLAAGLYLWAVYRLSRRLLGTGVLFLAGVAVTTLNPVIWDFLSAARGYGMALAFWMMALDLLVEYLQANQPSSLAKLNLAGILLGLSAAANVAFLWQAVALAAIFLAATVAKGRAVSVAAVERVVIPAVVVGFIFLAIPLSHAHLGGFVDGAAPSWLWLVPPASLLALWLVAKTGSKALLVGTLTVAALVVGFDLSRFRLGAYSRWPQDAGARNLVAALRQDAAGRPVEIGASRDLQPILRFYQARYRLANWGILGQRQLPGNFDYYVLDVHEAALVDERHLTVLYRDSGLILASHRL